MYSGLLPSGLTEADLSSEDDGDVRETETNEHLSPQSSTETHPACVQLESNVNRTTDLQTDALCDDDCPPGVSLDKWQRFKELQRAKSDQRVKQPKTKRQRKRRHKKRGTQTQNDDAEQKRKLEEKEENWKELTQFFGMKDKFEPPPCNRPPPKSGLEKSIESAIAEGDYGTAEELSDRLATREMGVKIAQAADCRDFTRSKREAEASQAARKRRKQIAWGFEAKQRWETKSNMGFM